MLVNTKRAAVSFSPSIVYQYNILILPRLFSLSFVQVRDASGDGKLGQPAAEED